MLTDEEPKAGHKLMWWGGAITVAYIVGLAIYAYVSRQSFLTLPPNEVGDFLAGAFSPLAFFWLVLGFIQQGQELRNSADALWLQGKELKNSVEQQRALVQVTTEQLALEREARRNAEESENRAALPVLILSEREVIALTSHTQYVYRLTNMGQTCSNLHIIVEGTGAYEENARFETFSHMTVIFDLHSKPDKPFSIVCSYFDRLGVERKEFFNLNPDGSNGGWGFAIAKAA